VSPVAEPAAPGRVLAYLASLSPIPEDELRAFVAEKLSAVDYPAGHFFVRAGDLTARIGFVERGLFRVYYTGQGGRRHVRNFCAEGAPIGAYGAILAGQPANVSIEALEDARVLELPYRAMAAQFATSALWERCGRRIAEAHYQSRERREHALLMLDAQGRLSRFHADFPGLAARLPRSDVASYIGVRPETLSRLFHARKR
jgi:CRP-like cAMP-binding protein